MRNAVVAPPALVAAALALCLAAATAPADPIVLTMVPEDFANLGATTVAGTLLTPTYDDNGAFTGTVYSKVYNTTGGDYLYLYQVRNGGPSVLEKQVVFPIAPVDQAGYLTANEPSEFLGGGSTPLSIVYDPILLLRTLGFDYPAGGGFDIGAGEHSTVVYVLSSSPPRMGESHVIDGGTGSVEVWTPEPASLALLAGGGTLLLLRRKRRRA